MAQRKTNGSNNQIGLSFEIRENFEGGLRDALAEREFGQIRRTKSD